jgi:hypothetical protein
VFELLLCYTSSFPCLLPTREPSVRVERPLEAYVRTATVVATAAATLACSPPPPLSTTCPSRARRPYVLTVPHAELTLNVALFPPVPCRSRIGSCRSQATSESCCLLRSSLKQTPSPRLPGQVSIRPRSFSAPLFSVLAPNVARSWSPCAHLLTASCARPGRSRISVHSSN